MKAKLDLLSEQLDGDVHYDDMMRSLYATDASVYREMPLAVVLPKHSKDVQILVDFARSNTIAIIPRAAGTSLAGQCVGNGLIMDISKYMNQILEINTDEKWVRVQPGVVRDELNLFLKDHGLFFGPNTSTANRCNIGGMVGNNSCGTTSIVYGSTRDHVLELKTILSEGSEITFGALTDEEFLQKTKHKTLEGTLYAQMDTLLSDWRNKELIEKEYPKASVTRRNTGYALDALIKMKPVDSNGKPFNFCSLLCGSEGTLALTTEITLNLVPLPKPHCVVLAAHFRSIDESLHATILAMNHKPTACELMDKTILDCTKDNIEQQKNRYFIDGDPSALLMIEFREDSQQEALEKAHALTRDMRDKALGYAFPIIKGDKTSKVWDLRNAGLGVLANIPGDKKAVACIEDTAVSVNDLPDYIRDFSKMMAAFKQEAVYYAHAGAGELHLRPILDLKKSEDVSHFRKISEASAKLVKLYGGSLSGEHGDGRVRAEFIPLVLGKKVYKLLEEIKRTWDPSGLFNPAKIVDAKPMDSNLRYQADAVQKDIETIFNFEETGGILRTVEKCNGSGDCRKLNFAGGTMCPSYRATRDEKDTTRGRANVLREFLTQNVKDNPFDHPEIKTAMDLCLSCKGCKSECPSNIDMATLKSEFLYQYHKTHKIPFRSKLIANSSAYTKRFQKYAKIYNTLTQKKWFKSLMGFGKERSLPQLQKTSLRDWFDQHEQPDCKKDVFLFCDEFTDHYDVEIGKKTVLVLNRLGYKVLICDHPESGRAQISKGFLDIARQLAHENIECFSTLVTDKKPLVGIEPSAILGFRDEYPNLVDPAEKKKALILSKNVFLIDEFLSTEIANGNITADRFTSDKKNILLHGHCHQKALSSLNHTVELLGLPINYSVDVIPSGCCGMAGSFGYEKEHFELSQNIGNQILFPAILNTDKNVIIAAPGTSCRHQILDGTGRQAKHPVEILFDALL